MIKNVLDITVLSTGTSGIPVGLPSLGGSPVAAAGTVRVLGSAALSGAYNISPTGTPVKNTFIEIYWEASASGGASHAVVVFGKTVPAELITSASKFKVDCLYNGTAWVVDVLPDDAGTGIVGAARIASDAVTTVKIADDAVTLAKMEGQTDGKILIGDTAAGVTANVISGDATMIKGGVLTIASNAITTAKILDANVTSAKLSASARKETLTIPVSFASAARIANPLYFKVCFDCTVDAIHGTVLEPFATDAGTVIVKDGSGAVMTAGQLDFGTGLVGGNIVSVTPSANTTLTAGQTIKLELSKSTVGSGEALLVFCLTRN